MPILGISASQNTKSFLYTPVFAAVADTLPAAALSTDGITWASPSSGPVLPSAQDKQAIAYGGGVFAAEAIVIKT